MRLILTAFSALLLVGAQGRIDTSMRGRVEATMPASGVHPLTEQLINPPIVIGPPISGYHSETLNFISRVEAAGGGLTVTQKDAVDTFIRSAHANGWRTNSPRANVRVSTNLNGAFVTLWNNTGGLAVVGYTNDLNTGFVEGDFSGGVLVGDGSSYTDTGLAPSNFMSLASGGIILAVDHGLSGSTICPISSGEISDYLGLDIPTDADNARIYWGIAVESVSTTIGTNSNGKIGYVSVICEDGTLSMYRNAAFLDSGQTNSSQVSPYPLKTHTRYNNVRQASRDAGYILINANGVTSNQNAQIVAAWETLRDSLGIGLNP